MNVAKNKNKLWLDVWCLMWTIKLLRCKVWSNFLNPGVFPMETWLNFFDHQLSTSKWILKMLPDLVVRWLKCYQAHICASDFLHCANFLFSFVMKTQQNLTLEWLFYTRIKEQLHCVSHCYEYQNEQKMYKRMYISWTSI